MYDLVESFLPIGFVKLGLHFPRSYGSQAHRLAATAASPFLPTTTISSSSTSFVKVDLALRGCQYVWLMIRERVKLGVGLRLTYYVKAVYHF